MGLLQQRMGRSDHLDQYQPVGPRFVYKYSIPKNSQFTANKNITKRAKPTVSTEIELLEVS